MNSENKDGRNDTTDKPKPKHFPDEVDTKHTDGMHDEPSGRVGIAPAKPLWPSKN